MSLDKDQVQHIAMLARLEIADTETTDVVEKLSRIVDFVDQLSQARSTFQLQTIHRDVFG